MYIFPRSDSRCLYFSFSFRGPPPFAPFSYISVSRRLSLHICTVSTGSARAGEKEETRRRRRGVTMLRARARLRRSTSRDEERERRKALLPVPLTRAPLERYRTRRREREEVTKFMSPRVRACANSRPIIITARARETYRCARFRLRGLGFRKMRIIPGSLTALIFLPDRLLIAER